MDADIVHALLRTIELKDGSTAAHTWRVVLYSRLMAEKFGADAQTLRRITYAAALHDLGKLDIPDHILLKPGKLTAEEFEVVQTHPVRGHERLVAMGETDQLLIDIVRSHHERIDGTGYPDRLTADRLPRAAKYFAVIDSFDALTSIRPYRQQAGPRAAEAAMQELHDCIGTRYCADCVRAFNDLYRAGELDWILEHYNDLATLDGFGDANLAEKAHRGRPRRA